MNAAARATIVLKSRLVFLAAQGEAFEAFERADGPLDTGPVAIRGFGGRPGGRPGVLAERDHRDGSACAGDLAVRGAVMALVRRLTAECMAFGGKGPPPRWAGRPAPG